MAASYSVLRDLRGGGASLVRRSFAAIAAAGVLWTGPAASFDNLTFTVTGEEDLEEGLRAASLLVATQDEDVTDPAEILAAARAEYGRLVGALYSEGYYGGVISVTIDGREAAEISPLADLGRIGRVVVTVDPGARFRFSQADIGPLAPDTEIPEEFAVGEPAPSGVIVEAARSAVTGWRAVGHAKAEVAGQSVVAQHDRGMIAAEIAMGPGPRARFGRLTFTGSNDVREERLRAIAGYPRGEVFDPEELEDVERRLRQTQVFSAVALTEAETLNYDDTLDIRADLVAYPPRRIGFGAEYSTDDGATLTAFWLHRNLFGGAERLRIDGSVSGLGSDETDEGNAGTDYGVGIRLERPATFSPENTLFVEARAERLNEEDYTSNVGTLGFGINRYVNDRIEVEYGLAYRFSRVEADGETTDYSMLTAPLSGTYDSRENELDPKGGFYAALGVTPFYGLNDETGDGARLTWDGRTYVSFGADDRFTLAGRVQGGSIAGADLERVPNDYRFYSGGGGTVRGHSYQSLGVTLDDGVESGGASFVGVSAEARIGVTESIGVVAFYDYGIVGRDAFPGSDSEDHAGAGLGLRYLTPIGPIRLDVATPVSSPEDEDASGVEVYIGIGQAF